MESGCPLKTTVTLLEQLILSLVVLLLPVHLLAINYLKHGLSWTGVNYFMITSICYSIIFLLMLVFYFLFDKPYLAMILGCHQIKSRSFILFNKQFVVCTRCTGILTGVVIMPLIVFIVKINPLWYLLGIIPVAIDGLFQYFSAYESNHIKRMMTGIFFAPAFILIMSYFYLLIVKGMTALALLLIR